MARFDVHSTPFADEKRHTPYWLDVQSEHLAHLATRVIVPLRRRTAKSLPAADLNPILDIDGTSVFADVANIASFPKALLKRPVSNLRNQRLAIEDALDFLFTGL